MKLCKKCGESKNKDDFYQYKRYQDGVCKLCRNSLNRDWRKNNPDMYENQKIKNKLRNRKPKGRISDLKFRLILIKDGKNKCSTCEEIKPLKVFTPRKLSSTGYDNRCSKCKAITNKNSKLKRYYNLNLEKFSILLEKQKGLCEICRTDLQDKKICVDHCHTTNIIRGLLCDHCNRGLGLLKDNTQVLYSAIRYLKKASSFKIPLNGETPEEDNPVLNSNEN